MVRIAAAALIVIGFAGTEVLAQSTAPATTPAPAAPTTPPERLQGTTTQNNPATSATPPPPPVANSAVTVGNTDDASLSPGANSFTEDEARDRIKGAGYADVSHLVLDRNGIWRGSASKDGRTLAVALDFKGTVAAH